MPEGYDKRNLLAVLSETSCPICSQPKPAQKWTCATCGHPYRLSDEHAALNRTCDAHMDAAYQFLQMVKAGTYKPEAD